MSGKTMNSFAVEAPEPGLVLNRKEWEIIREFYFNVNSLRCLLDENDDVPLAVADLLETIEYRFAYEIFDDLNARAEQAFPRERTVKDEK